MSVPKKFPKLDRNAFAGGAKAVDTGEGGLGDIIANWMARQRGVIPSARLAFSVNPSNNDVMAIGGHTFKFVTNLAAAGAQTQVKIGGSAAVTLARLLNALNGVIDANVVPATTTFAAGAVATDILTLAGQPADADTVTIGGQVFEFDVASPPVAGGGAAHIGVYRGASLADAINNLVDAINGTVNAATWTPGDGSTSVPSVFADVDGNGHLRVRYATGRGIPIVVPAVPATTALATTVAGSSWDQNNLNLGGGVQAGNVLADAPTATSLRIKWADKNGGTPQADGLSNAVALTASISGGASEWSVADLGATGKAGGGAQDHSMVKVVVTQEMLDLGTAYAELDFVATDVHATGNSDEAAFSLSADGKTVVIAMTDGHNPYFNLGETARAVALA